MKNKLFPIFITLLGFFTAYVFYAFWHTEEVNPSYSIEKPKEHLAHKKNISREIDTTSNSLIRDNAKNIDMKVKEEVIPFQTAEKMETQTHVVYESLMPENHEETMQEANEAFNILDSEMQEIEEELAEEEQYKEESMRIEIETEPREEDTQLDDVLKIEDRDME